MPHSLPLKTETILSDIHSNAERADPCTCRLLQDADANGTLFVRCEQAQYLTSMLPLLVFRMRSDFQCSSTGAALSLLLVFRTNSAYARVYDARCIWGQLTNTIRSGCLILSKVLRQETVADM